MEYTLQTNQMANYFETGFKDVMMLKLPGEEEGVIVLNILPKC